MRSIQPETWRFTWETQLQSPIIKLFLFDSSNRKPSLLCNCKNLQVHLNLPRSHLLFTWTLLQEEETEESVSLRVPIPTVLIDPESKICFRVLGDHIEVKLQLLLPVNHPLVSTSILSDFDSEDDEVTSSSIPLLMDYDLKSLKLLVLEGVHFYCRSCSTKLTRSPLRRFVEMPSVNWIESADNWFGGCCCSFGGASEKLVNRYADAYTCDEGVCLLDLAVVTLCKEDLVGFNFADSSSTRNPIFGRTDIHKTAAIDSGKLPGQCDKNYNSNGRLTCPKLDAEEERNCNATCSTSPMSAVLKNAVSRSGCCETSCHAQGSQYSSCIEEGLLDLSLEDKKAITETPEVTANKKSLLNGCLGGVFMARSYNLCADIKWKQLVCPQCSSLLGAYPCADGDEPIDGGVRLFKCYISTSLPVGESSDLFRKYGLDKMFANQLVESAKEELSFRVVVRELTNKCPMLQVILLNPNIWHCTGNCLDADSTRKSNLQLQPAIKLLFSDCSRVKDSQSRVIEDWIKRNLAEEVFMLKPQIEELIETLASANHLLPPSCSSFMGLSLSSLPR